MSYVWAKSDLWTMAIHVWPKGVTNLEGSRAVDLFFMISGFVIFMTIQNAASVYDFIASRVARLFPAFLFSVVMTSLMILAIPIHQQHVSLLQFLANLTMLENFIGIRAVDPVYWSLSFELGFYLCIGTLFAYGGIRHIEAIGIFWVLGSFVTTNILPMWGFTLPWRVGAIFALPYAALFFSGIIYYKMWSDRATTWRIVLVIFSFVEYTAFKGLWFTEIIFCIYVLFALCVAGKLKVLTWKPLTYLGSISYALYLTHPPLAERLEIACYRAGLPDYVSLAIAVSVALVVAALVTRFVDRPGHRAIASAYRDARTIPAHSTG
jgi:peptidoglycan/LPS O-acetylase OafA/YrhL